MRWWCWPPALPRPLGCFLCFPTRPYPLNDEPRCLRVLRNRVGKHKKHPSGRGNAGGQHQHRLNWDKYHPGYFGKVGMRHFHKKANPTWKPTINVSQVASLIPADQLAATKKGDLLPVIDLLSHGYAKLLGNGRLQVPCIVKARYVSERAEAKMKKAGGAVVLQA